MLLLPHKKYIYSQRDNDYYKVSPSKISEHRATRSLPLLPETYNEPPNTPTYALGSRPRALKSAAKTES